MLRTAQFCTLLLLAALAQGPTARACPFCAALAPSFYEEIARVDFVAIASCSQLAEPEAELPFHSFRIEEFLHIGSSVAESDQTRVPLGGNVQGYSQKEFQLRELTLMFGILSDGEMAWAPSSPLSQTGVDYARSVAELRSTELSMRSREDISPVSRDSINLFWDNLESEDAWVRRDAYNSLAPYTIDQLRPWAAEIDPSELKSRISQPSTSRDHRRFYWTILGLCGSSKDSNFVEEAVSRRRKQLALNPLVPDSIGLDAALSCRLLLGGESALKDVERDFLKNPASHPSERFAALSALRVHLEEFQVFNKDRICKSFALLLDDPEFADQVLPDLARLEDWSHVAKIRAIFRNTKPGQEFVLVPIINYLRACPLPEATAALAEAQELAPAAYRRAQTIFPFIRRELSPQ